MVFTFVLRVARVATFWLPSGYPTWLWETLIRIKIEPNKIWHYFFFPVKAEIMHFPKILIANFLEFFFGVFLGLKYWLQLFFENFCSNFKPQKNSPKKSKNFLTKFFKKYKISAFTGKKKLMSYLFWFIFCIIFKKSWSGVAAG